ncbi:MULTISPECIES: hypothetical protein [unclassified Sphingomonas]|uniref:hypothetical protein n=1 Tax=unclassified Sphingomonas TaxID=196159 RepID=UPI0006F74B33|nr:MULTISPECIES: hypothetical protein [unclassified Sphingomonas]KQX24272.1 hypothetical protein ASD17_25405 [Sphingomonas sp. Root1294]KQY69555.1 hypothetical protein ASD39_24630 [Sphingomonas sp. Root50]KRB87483.1 hypothetical protein ASE22_24180 [Sphingomonas sp. Root720]
MAEQFEFELLFALPEGEHDPLDISNAVFEAGFEDALVGTGVPGLLGVELEEEGSDAEAVILEAARKLLKALPAGTSLREVRPDLVSLADVAERLNVKRQALQQREMPLPSLGGLYRVDEVAVFLTKAMTPEASRRRPRFDLERASNWLRAGPAARLLNARLTTRELDPVSVEYVAEKGRDKVAAG